MAGVGYIVGSHVVYNHAALPILLESMAANGVDFRRIVVVVNGSAWEHEFVQNGATFVFRKPEESSHFAPIVDLDLGPRLGITHWFYLNCTSRCGPRFRELVEGGFDPNADATHAGPILPITSRGKDGKAINDLCMYRHDYLLTQREHICSQMEQSSAHAHIEFEGLLYAVAPKQARYPGVDYVTTGPTDVYGTGTPRITEYFHAIDWYRFKKNWGQMTGGTYKNAVL